MLASAMPLAGYTHPNQHMSESRMVLVAENLSRNFDVSRPWLQRSLAREPRQTLRAVDGVTFAIPRGTTL